MYSLDLLLTVAVVLSKEAVMKFNFANYIIHFMLHTVR